MWTAGTIQGIGIFLRIQLWLTQVESRRHYGVGHEALNLRRVDVGSDVPEPVRRVDDKRAASPQVAIYSHPWQQRGALWNVLCGAYVAIFSAYWVANLVHLAAVELRALAEVRHFCNHKLGLSERQLQTVTWPEVVHRMVQVRPDS